MQVRALTYYNAQCESLYVALSVYQKKKGEHQWVTAHQRSWILATKPKHHSAKQDMDAESKFSFSSITLAASPKH